jgi:hypothetical protein
MSTITADANLLSVLSQVKGVTEIRDGDGNLIGTFTPRGITDEKIKKLFDLDRAREKLATEKVRPFREMIDSLEKLAEKKG